LALQLCRNETLRRPTEIDEARLRAHFPKCRRSDVLLIVLGMETALRISELVALRVQDVWRNRAPVSVLHCARRHLKGGRGSAGSGGHFAADSAQQLRAVGAR